MLQQMPCQQQMLLNEVQMMGLGVNNWHTQASSMCVDDHISQAHCYVKTFNADSPEAGEQVGILGVLQR